MNTDDRALADDVPTLREALEAIAHGEGDAVVIARQTLDANPIADPSKAAGGPSNVPGSEWRDTPQAAMADHLAADRLEAFHAKPDDGGDFVAGPVWSDDECWTSEIQVVGGHYVVATVHGGSEAEAIARRDACLAALQSKSVVGKDASNAVKLVRYYKTRGLDDLGSGEIERLYEAAIVLSAALQSPPPVVSPLPEPVASAELGLYRVHWRSGGSSLAAIGMQSDGSRWLAPTNWVAPAMHDAGNGWAEIASLERIQPEPEDCPHCQGEGTIEHPFLTGAYGGSHAIDPPDPVIVECEDCHGTGKVEIDD